MERGLVARLFGQCLLLPSFFLSLHTYIYVYRRRHATINIYIHITKSPLLFYTHVNPYPYHILPPSSSSSFPLFIYSSFLLFSSTATNTTITATTIRCSLLYFSCRAPLPLLLLKLQLANFHPPLLPPLISHRRFHIYVRVSPSVSPLSPRVAHPVQPPIPFDSFSVCDPLLCLCLACLLLLLLPPLLLLLLLLLLCRFYFKPYTLYYTRGHHSL